MPNDDLHISVTTKAYVKRDFALLWQFSAGTETSAPGFAGTGACPFDSQKINAGDQTAYAFTVTKNEGMATIKGRLNQRIGLNQYLDEAEVVIRLKLDTPSSNRTVTVGVSGSTLTKTVTVGADWTTVRIPLKDLLSGDTLPGLTFSLTERSVGDVLAIGDICIWSQPGLSNDAGFEHIFDISDYEKQETNTLLGTIGHTEMPVDPWNELKLDEQALSWDLAWYYSFQNMAPWIVTPKEEGAGNPYLLTFYGWDVKEDKVAPIDVSACIETGYMEFFIKGNKDGMTVPFAVQSSAGGRKYAPFTVTYDASKARSDGYMRVRIPFTYLADMGLDMSTIAWVSIAGMQDIEDFVLLSSFRLYSHYADVPEPEEPEEEQPPVERDFPLELDASILNARLDIDKRILYVPQNTYIWEVLAALRLDTEEVTVGFFEGDEEPVTDTERELVEGMLLRLYRRGFTVADFQVVIDQAKVAGTGGSNDEETGNVNTGVASAAALPAALAVLSGLTLPVLARRSRRKPKH